MQAEKQFELKTSADKVMLRVRPPGEGEKKIQLSEIQKDLDAQGVNYDAEKLFAIYRRALNEFEPLANRETTAYEITVKVTEDGQQAYLTVIPPTVGREPLTPAQFKKAIEEAKLTKGILYDELRRVMAQHIMNKAVLIARGAEAVEGEDGRMEFIQDDPAKPPMGFSDRVDLRERNLIRNVKEGQLIAKVYPPTEGMNGYTVTGKLMRARSGKRTKLRLGPNMAFNEDKTEIRAIKGGFLVVTSDKVSVEDTYEVENVNAATGHVRFSGVVSVRGAVEDGFNVEAGKGLNVGSTIGKSIIKCEGNVTAMGGMMGATIDAHGSISAKFFSDCTLKARENVVAEEYILHSTVEANMSVMVTRPTTGFIKGGHIRAGVEISAPVIGSEMSEGVTKLEVGLGVDVRGRFEKLQVSIAKNWAAFEKARKNLLYLQLKRDKEGALDDEQQGSLLAMVPVAKKLQHELWEAIPQHHELLAGMAGSGTACAILVPGMVHAGTSIQVQRYQMRVASALKDCGFIIADSALKVMDHSTVAKLMKFRKRQENLA